MGTLHVPSEREGKSGSKVSLEQMPQRIINLVSTQLLSTLPLLNRANNRGADTFDSLRVLVYQATSQRRLWQTLPEMMTTNSEILRRKLLVTYLERAKSKRQSKLKKGHAIDAQILY